MSDFSERCGPMANGGAVIGGLTGFSLMIYFGVTLIQPEFEKTKGINETGADGITAAICLIGMGAAIGGGILAGACTGSILNCTYTAGSMATNNAYNFFSRSSNSHASAQVPAHENAGEIEVNSITVATV